MVGWLAGPVYAWSLSLDLDRKRVGADLPHRDGRRRNRKRQHSRRGQRSIKAHAAAWRDNQRADRAQQVQRPRVLCADIGVVLHKQLRKLQVDKLDGTQRDDGPGRARFESDALETVLQ